MATDEEVQAARSRVESLREELANNERTRINREQEMANDITLTQLKAEEARLEAQLAQQGDSSSEEAVRRGAQSPIAAAQADMERAALVQKAVAERIAPKSDETPTEVTPAPTPPTSPIPAVPAAPTTAAKKGGSN